MKSILKKIDAAYSARERFDTKCILVLKDVEKLLRFDRGVIEFHIEYQPSDGLILADSSGYIYDLPRILADYKKVKKLDSIKGLRQTYSI